MEATTIFLILFILGVFIGIGLYFFKEREKRKTYKLIEMEVIENLKELKAYMDTGDKEFSKEFDLVEIALTYDIGDIIVVDDEGLIIASTLKDADDIGAIDLGIFEYAKKFYKDIKKIIIQRKDKYIYIYPIKLCNEHLYIILESKIMLEIVDEREIIKKTCNVIKNYFKEFEDLNVEKSDDFK
ncbi:roadblock/LC7 domain-containing protein [Methanocaldococcus sp.]|uniref:roadblock/LC7 domain-containing protein n=1 Tax=Methanocaldococcus sp. TaxID=2152917 RepID=UPI0026295AFD|nr:roadblock/LC7 domain-containing protein [Methanocaldococcus sp.]MCQ6254849.1 roadblock/LC7 domain-containing protein [Methanocaldococcus sp.]